MNRDRLVRIYRPSQEIVCSQCRYPLRIGDYHLEPASRESKRVWCSCAANDVPMLRPAQDAGNLSESPLSSDRRGGCRSRTDR